MIRALIDTNIVLQELTRKGLAGQYYISAGMLLGLCGIGRTPLRMANKIEWITPQSEYRPTECMQGWTA